MTTYIGFKFSDLTFPGTGQLRIDRSYDSATAYSFEPTDDDGIWSGDSASNSTPDDASQQIVIVRDGNGVTVASGRSYLEHARTISDGFGNEINFYQVMIGTEAVGFVADSPIQPGTTYDFIETDVSGSNAPLYTSLFSQTYSPTQSNTIEGLQYDDDLTGGDNADTITGGDGHDTIQGQGGDDLIDGGEGNDILNSGAGNDTLLGGNGNDRLEGGEGNDSLVAGSGNDTVLGSSGDDTLDGGDGADSLFGGIGNDSILGGAFSDTLDGGDGDDYLNGGEGTDLLSGGDGHDSIEGGARSDTIYGGAGNDTISLGDPAAGAFGEFADGGDGDDSITGTNGSSTIYGGIGNDTIDGGDDWVTSDRDDLYGGEGDDLIRSGMVRSPNSSASQSNGDFLSGGAGADTLIGGTADDTLEGGIGNDSIDGGTGNDTISGGDGADTLGGGDGDDYIDGGDGDDFLTTGLGQDTLMGGDGADTLMNSDGDDSLDGGAGDDSIVATGGMDTLRGGTGSDYMDGGDDADTFIIEDNFGNDTIIGGEGTTDGTDQDLDTIDLSMMTGPVTVTYTGDEAGTITDGTDTITFSEIERLILTEQADVVDGFADTAGLNIEALGGDDSVEGGSGADFIDGGTGNDTLFGWGGDDTLIGADGNDSLDGDDGNDSLDGGIGDDTIIGDAGNDTVFGGDGADQIYDSSGANSLSGGDGNDSIFGGADSDTISGDTGDDFLVGNGGDDLIIGGLGNDTLEGGTGNDTFVYTPGSGSDTIIDFNTGNTGTLNDGNSTNNDSIDLSNYYDNIFELHRDQADDGVLNQSNTTGPDAVDYSNNVQFATGESITFQGASADNSSFTSENTGVVCFTTGTAIRTPRGDVLIDDLRVGDLVTTMDNGPQRIAWIGQRHVTRSEMLENDRLQPILIKKSVMGAQRDLLVSRQHGMLLGTDYFGRAVHLSKTVPGVRVANGKRQVTYVHLMFEAHQVIFAEGIPSESFYPGPMALEMLSMASREEMEMIFPQLNSAVARKDVIAAYGNTARVFLENKKAVNAWLSKGSDDVKKEIRNWDVYLANERCGVRMRCP